MEEKVRCNCIWKSKYNERICEMEEVAWGQVEWINNGRDKLIYMSWFIFVQTHKYGGRDMKKESLAREKSSRIFRIYDER